MARVIMILGVVVGSWSGLSTSSQGQLLFGSFALAQTQETMTDPQTALNRLFTAESTDASWFTPEFLASVPTSRMDAILTGMKEDFGGFVAAQVEDIEGTMELERAVVPVSITLDGAGRIAGLLFQTPEPLGGDIAGIANRIAESGVGQTSILVTYRSKTETGEGAWRDHFAMGADEPMAVASAFKLAVLRAYEDAIASGEMRRTDVIELVEADRSLPTGVLQTLRPGTPVTLETLAALMIQHSDNTATDALIRVLGRERIEAISSRNRPFLTTAELFKLASIGSETERGSYAAGDEAARRDILEVIADMDLPTLNKIRPRATWQDVEWFLTARELCALLETLQEAPALNGAEEPLIASEEWSWTGFKGGSEFGVLNLSAAATTQDGRTVCVVITANGQETQPNDRLSLLFSTLFRQLAKIPD